MVLRLRITTGLLFLALLPSLGFAGSWYWHQRRIERLYEEREGYRALAQKAIDMSDRAFHYVHSTKVTLDLCLSRAYAPTATLPKGVRGGVGGPDVSKQRSRLP